MDGEMISLVRENIVSSWCITVSEPEGLIKTQNQTWENGTYGLPQRILFARKDSL